MELLFLLLNGFLLGVFLGLLSDLLRLARSLLGISYGGDADLPIPDRPPAHLPPMKKRKTVKANGVLRFAGDFFFCVFASAALVLMLYEGNRGKIRVLPILAVGCGFLLYRKTLGVWCQKLFGWVGFCGLAAIRYACLPAAWLKKRLCRRVGILRSAIMQKQRVAYTKRQFIRVKKDGCGIIPKRKGDDQSETASGQHDSAPSRIARIVHSPFSRRIRR